MNEQSIIKRRSPIEQAMSINRIVQSATAPIIDKLEKALEINRELVEALELLMQWIGPPPKDKYSFDNLREDSWEKASEAIRKAKGDSQ